MVTTLGKVERALATAARWRTSRHSGWHRTYRRAVPIEVPLGTLVHLSARATARRMSLGLMRRGPSTFAKFRSDDLLD